MPHVDGNKEEDDGRKKNGWHILRGLLFIHKIKIKEIETEKIYIKKKMNLK